MMGYILEDLTYTGMLKPGRIVIESDKNGIRVIVSDFVFADSGSCREYATKSMMWAAEVLDVAIKANVLVPGGTIVSVVDG